VTEDGRGSPVDSSDRGAATGAAGDQPPRAKRGSFLRELPFLLLVAFLLALLIKAFLVQAFYIPSGSMERTLLIGDRVLVNKVVYRIRDVHRGEVVVFKGPDTWAPEVVLPEGNGVQRALRGLARVIGVGPPGEKDFIKRVVGLPGDTVTCCTNGQVTVQAPGQPPVALNEPYLYDNNPPPERAFPPVTVPPGQLWVMGDHRGASADSRAHAADRYQGTVAATDVIGRAFVRVWPLSRLAALSVPATFSHVRAAGGSTAPYAAGLAVALPMGALGRRRHQHARHRRQPAAHR
jgi:signal peptidase I